MRLLRLEVQDLKRYTGAPRVVSFDPRGTVLHDANEAGKSTLFEAVRRVLFDRSHTQARWVERLVPYRTRAVPLVRLDFEHNGRTLRIEKRFGSKGDAVLLDRGQNGEWSTVARNEEAEEKLLEILGAVATGARDGAPPDSWGAFQWLFVPQDLRALPDERADAAGHLGLDAAGVSDGFEAVRRFVQEEFDRTFTPTGQVAARSELAAVEKSVANLEEERTRIKGELDRLSELRQRHDEKVEELPRLRQDVAQAKTDWETAQTEAEGLSIAQGEQRTAAEALRGATDRAEAAAGVIKERLQLEKAARSAEEARAGAVAEDIRAKELLDQSARSLKDAREEAVKQADLAAGLQRKTLDAQRCMLVREARGKVEALHELHRRATKADAKVAKARTAIGADPPKPAIVKRAQELDGSAREKRAAANVAAPSVTVEGKPGVRVLADGRSVAKKGAIALDEVVVEAKSGRVVVRGDTTQARRLTDEAQDLDRKLAELLAPFNVETAEELRELQGDRQKRKDELDRAIKEREAIDGRTTDEIASAIALLEAKAVEAEQARRESAPDPAHDALSEEGLRAAMRRLEGEFNVAERSSEMARLARDHRSEEYEQHRTAHAEAATKRARAEAVAANAAYGLDLHRDTHGSTDKCREAATNARKDLDQAVAREARAKERVERLEREAESHRKSTQQKYVRLDETLRAMEAEVRQLAEMLDRESVRGAYSRLGTVERTMEAERARRDRLQLAARAVDHLRTIVEEVRGEVVQRVVAPIKGDLESLLATATAGRYTLANLDDHLRPGMLSGAAKLRCEFEDGSQGLRELVATLVRVAVAMHLSKTEPQTLILDDPCVHVSRERTARLVEILNARTAEGRVQVVILTHRPSEFLGLLGGAVDVGAL